MTSTIVGAHPSAPRPSAEAPRRSNGNPPSRGDAAVPTRGTVHHPGRVAPAPVQFLARTLVLALAFFGIHAAASHPLAALTLAAVAFAGVWALSTRR